MNLFLPSFFDDVRQLPGQHGGTAATTLQPADDCGGATATTAFLSTTLLSLLILFAALEASVLVVCTLYSWFKFPFADFRWIDDEEENDDMLTAATTTTTAASSSSIAPSMAMMATSSWSSPGATDEAERRRRQIREALREEAWVDDGDDDGPPRECPICLTEFRRGDSVVTPIADGCRCHAFHKDCLHRWLARRSTCPCCRRKVLDAPPPREVEEDRPHAAEAGGPSIGAAAADGGGPPVSIAAMPSYAPVEEAWGFCLFLF